MKIGFAFVAIFAMSLFSSSAYSSDDSCKDILVDGAMKRTTLRSHSFFMQILAAEYAKKTDEEIDQQLSHNGSMSWAGITFGGRFNKNDVKRYIEELRTKLNVSTVMSNESSTVLASGDPEIVQAWAACIQTHGGLGMRFEALSPTKAILRIIWYAYPAEQGVPTATKLRDKIPIPKDVTVVSGKECLKKGQPLLDKVPCSVNLEFKSGEPDLLLIANSTLDTAKAYLPPRRILVSER